MFICGKCNSTVTQADNSSQTFVKCFGICRRLFHSTCVALSSANVKQCNNSKNVKFVCDDCCNDNPFQSSIQQLNHLTNTLGVLTSTFEKCANIMMTNFNNCNSYNNNVTASQSTASSTLTTTNNNNSDSQLPIVHNKPRSMRRNILIGTALNKDNMETVEPRKWIFISRFSSTVTEDNITQYIRNNFNTEDVNCQRVLPKNVTEHNRPYSSFKINVPASLYLKIMSADAWPQGVLIKDFVGRNYKQQDFLVTL